jgi:SAM-dependent methyltransferase
MPVSHDFYATPAIYDILHTPGTAGEVDALLRLARRFLPNRRASLTFLEPACGTGRYLRVLASRGHRAIGFDREPVMVEYAAGRLARFGGRARVFEADMREFASHLAESSVDLAFTPINSMRHLPTDSAILAHFGQIARVLKPGGFYAVGVSITAYGVEQPSEDMWEGTRGGCHVHQLVQYLPAAGGRGVAARAERVISHLTVTTPSATHHLDSTYALRSYDLGQWEALVGRSALSIAAVVDEDGRELRLAPPGYGVFVLKRRRGAGESQ